ncbi:MAG: family 20 glycosylhydrolase [Lachnospiraceae bacterium]|jgi:hexosaminidase|nr:family 20 glycosylhydrolase [Lachnospiraceae bacterium]
MAYRAATNAGGVIEQRLQAMKAEPCEVQAKDYYCVVTRADFVKLPPLSAYLKESPDGYRLYADEQSIVIQAASPRGVLYGWQEWKKQGHIQVGLFKEDAPELSFRAAHMDLRYGFPNRKRLEGILENLIDLRYNTLILETENRLPFTSHPDIVEEEHFTADDLQWLNTYAKEHYLELIPLQQTLGHLEYALKKPAYAELREVRHQPENDPLYYPGVTGGMHYHDFDEICPCREAGYELVESLLQETMQFFPESRYIHIGSDEAWNLLYCPDCRKKYEKTGKTGLLLEHINRIADKVLSAGKTPIIWDDMLRHMTPAELGKLNPEIIVMSWLYYTPDSVPFISDFQKAGLQVLGAGAAKCSVGKVEALDMPDYEGRLANVDWWIQRCADFSLAGFAMTVWSNYSGTIAPPHPQFETAWLPLSYAAQKMWDPSLSQSDFLQSFMSDFFGVSQPLTGLGIGALLPQAEKAAEAAKQHSFEARMWHLALTAQIYRQKSQFVMRELYRYHQPITKAEKELLDRRVAEVTRLREWLKPQLQEALQSCYSVRETNIFMASRFETDEIIYKAYEG